MLALSAGYAKVTPSNLNTPFKAYSAILMFPDLISGYRSITLKSLRAASRPSAIVLRVGVNWFKLTAGIRRQKKIVKIEPP